MLFQRSDKLLRAVAQTQLQAQQQQQNQEARTVSVCPGYYNLNWMVCKELLGGLEINATSATSPSQRLCLDLNERLLQTLQLIYGANTAGAGYLGNLKDLTAGNKKTKDQSKTKSSKPQQQQQQPLDVTALGQETCNALSDKTTVRGIDDIALLENYFVW